MIKLLEKRPDGICLYEMENDQLRVLVTSYGVTLIEIDMKDENQKKTNVILGYETIDDYMAKSGTYFGALVGRVCNRLANGEYTLNGKHYHAAVNNGPNSLHGGLEGFSYKNFDSKIEGDKLIFTYVSKDGEEGYPGTLTLHCTLELVDNTLRISYDAKSDADTLLNLTQHTYFNLNGMEEDAGDHLMKISAIRHGLVDPDGLCMGKFREVEGTPLDFRDFAPVKQGFDQSDWNVKNANGIDHHFVLETGSPALILTDPKSGRTVEVETTLPGVQVYSANYVENHPGRDGKTYNQHWGVAVEPQMLPDSIHNQEHPDVILKKGEPFHEEILYRFYTK